MLFILPIALILYLILPSVALYYVTKKRSTGPKLAIMSVYFILLAVLIAGLFNLPTDASGSIEQELFRVVFIPLLLLPIIYPIGVWLIGLLYDRYVHKTALQNSFQ